MGQTTSNQIFVVSDVSGSQTCISRNLIENLDHRLATNIFGLALQKHVCYGRHAVKALTTTNTAITRSYRMYLPLKGMSEKGQPSF